ncbi:hypothetical protein [Rhizobium sp. AN80A]|nr:hypothetical protein [Rhizobium sp. AN80A]
MTDDALPLIYAIADIHGRADLLEAMLDHIADVARSRFDEAGRDLPG